MAVVIESNFYEGTEWKDISKVVFTSPNMVSPSTAGTRSHILPGEGALGTWYEDTSQMYRIEDHQEIALTDFYDFAVYVSYDTSLSGVEEMYVEMPNYRGFDTYIQERSGVEPIGYTDVTINVKDTKARLEYTLIQDGLDDITDTTGAEVETIIEQTTRECLTIVSREPTNCRDQVVSGGGSNPVGGRPVWPNGQYGNIMHGGSGSFISLPQSVLDLLYTPQSSNTGTSTTSSTLQVCDDMIYDISSEPHALTKTSVFKTKGWTSEVIEGLENCYLTFEFHEPIRVTAIQMNSVKYRESDLELPEGDDPDGNRGSDNFIAASKGDITVTVPHDSGSTETHENVDLSESVYGTGCSRIRDMEETVNEEKRYFIGNFEIQASTDEENWITVGTHAVDDKINATVYLTNGQYFTFYRINILNNIFAAALDTHAYIKQSRTAQFFQDLPVSVFRMCVAKKRYRDRTPICITELLDPFFVIRKNIIKKPDFIDRSLSGDLL